MTEDERLREALRAAFEEATPDSPSRDLWPLIVERGHAPARWSWLDLGLAAAVLILLSMRPDWLRLLAFHL